MEAEVREVDTIEVQPKPSPDTVKKTPTKQPVNPLEQDIKIAEIWIRKGRLMLDAPPEFWIDRPRAIGILVMCQDIVKNFTQPKEESRIMPVRKFTRGLAKFLDSRRHRK